MKTVKKYSTFEDLKSSEEKITDRQLSLKKHDEFEKVIKAISSAKALKNVVRQSK